MGVTPSLTLLGRSPPRRAAFSIRSGGWATRRRSVSSGVARQRRCRDDRDEKHPQQRFAPRSRPWFRTPGCTFRDLGFALGPAIMGAVALSQAAKEISRNLADNPTLSKPTRLSRPLRPML